MTLTKRIAGAVLLAGTFMACLAADADIHMNSVGFKPDLHKKASIASDTGAAAAAFTVRSVSDGAEAFSGTTSEAAYNIDTRENLRIADFSDFNVPGRYYLDVEGVGRSAEFSIDKNVFTEPYRTMMLGMYLWRCGAAVEAEYNGKTYAHAACHTADGGTYYIGGGTGDTRDATGGWHDAGDYNKYVVNSGAAVGLMLKAWERHSDILEKIDLIAVNKEGNIPAYLSEVKYNLDWVAKMQYDDGKVSHKLSTLNFCGMIMPETEKTTRFFAPWSTAATGSFVGMLAQAARIYEPYDSELAAEYLEKARISYRRLMDTTFVRETQTPFQTGQYGSDDDIDKRRWAAIELWETTGEDQYLSDYEGSFKTAAAGSSSLTREITWGNVNTMAALTYIASEREGRNETFVNTMRTRLATVADEIANNTVRHAYGRSFTSYYWGANGTIAGMAYILDIACSLNDDVKYRNAGQEILGHLFGRNYYGRSFVTGVGHEPPRSPHDRTSVAQKTAWPGRLIGGPHSDKGTAPAYLKDCATAATCWIDTTDDYWTNEVAINWNGAMIYALASFLEPQDPSGIASGRKVSARPAASGIKTTRIVRFKNGGAGTVVPPGAKIYSLDGRLVAHRKAGDAKAPVLNRSGVFIMRIDEKITK